MMVGRVTLDKAGRVVLPKPMRDELHLEPGDALEIETTGEEITLHPLRGQAQLRKKQGVWVFRSGEPLSASEVERVVHQVRREREPPEASATAGRTGLRLRIWNTSKRRAISYLLFMQEM
jgi:AbrB family looped-hinge helix DNA binding protein